MPIADAPRLLLLGPPLVVYRGEERAMGDGLPQRMLGYLALSGEWTSREHLAELLWPDAEPSRRLTNLRRVVGRLKELPWAVGVEQDRGRLRWRVESDAAEFGGTRLTSEERLPTWRGALLDGWRSDEDEPFGRWLADQRRRVHEVWRALVLERADTLVLDSRQAEGAIDLLAKVLEHDALDEETLQRLLSACRAVSGGKQRGLAAYQRFEAALKRDLGLAPLERTRQLALALSRNDSEPFPDRASVATGLPDVISGLGSATRRMLDAASLAAQPFTLEQIAPATALSDWLALDALEGAVSAGLLVVEEAGAYRFTDETLRRSVAAAVADERRALIEQRLAWALRRAGGSPALIAGHFEMAGRRADALRWHKLAAAEAVRLHMPAEALEHLARAAELTDDDAERLENALQRADLHDDTVDPHGREDALRQAAEAAERLADPESIVRVALARAGHAAERGRAEDAANEVEKAIAAGAKGAALAEAHYLMSRLHLWTLSLDASQAALDAALTEVPSEPSGLRGSINMGYFKVHAMRGDLPAAGTHLSTAIEMFQAVGRRDLLVDAICMKGVLLTTAGARPEAIRTLEEALTMAREMGLVHVQRSAILNLLKLHTDVADVTAAAPLIEEGLALAHDFETADAEAAFLLSVGYVRYLQGDLGTAWRAWERAVEIADADGNLLARISVRTAPFYPYLRSGEIERARKLLEETRPLVVAHGRSGVEPRLEIYAARLAIAEGLPEVALERLAPLHDRDDLPHEERSEVALATALALAVRGDVPGASEAVEQCRDAPTFEVALHALALRLRWSVLIGAPRQAEVEEAHDRLSDGRVTPFEAVDLMLALADAYEVAGKREAATKLRADAAARRDELIRSLPTVRT